MASLYIKTFEMRNLLKYSFNSSKQKNNLDKFDLIVQIYRFVGITYYGYNKPESKLKHILYAIYNFFMYLIVLIISSPCLLSSFNCNQNQNKKFFNKDIGLNQLMVYLIVRDIIGIASSLIYSTRGQQFRELIEELRNLFNELNGSLKLFKHLFLQIFLFILLSIITIIGFIVSHRRFDAKKLFLSILEAVGHFYICFLFLSTEYFIVYFTNYLAILQKLYSEYLLNYNKTYLNNNDVKEIKSKFFRIQNLIDSVSKILSPLLLLSCGSLFYNLVNCLFFTVKSFWNTESHYDQIFMSHNVGIVFYIIRLLFSCLYSERVNKQVFFRKLILLLINYNFSFDSIFQTILFNI